MLSAKDHRFNHEYGSSILNFESDLRQIALEKHCVRKFLATAALFREASLVHTHPRVDLTWVPRAKLSEAEYRTHCVSIVQHPICEQR